MRTLSLFSGIGGMDLGLERAGFTIVAQCEQDPFCRRVLAKHWPGVPCFEDVCTLEPGSVGAVDCICGGFPCQDVSVAGKGAGVDAGERSGLWREMFRVVRSLRPRWIIAENVPALRTRGADRVLGDLEGEGYACTPVVVAAADLGAPHRRERVFILAHAERDGRGKRGGVSGDEGGEGGGRGESEGGRELANATRGGKGPVAAGPGQSGEATRHPDGPGQGVVDADRPGQRAGRKPRTAGPDGGGPDVALASGERRQEPRAGQPGAQPAAAAPSGTGPWPALPGEPQHPWEAPRLLELPVGGAVDGVPARLVRAANKHALRAYGNAVVPQVAELIGRTVLIADRTLGAHA